MGKDEQHDYMHLQSLGSLSSPRLCQAQQVSEQLPENVKIFGLHPETNWVSCFYLSKLEMPDSKVGSCLTKSTSWFHFGISYLEH